MSGRLTLAVNPTAGGGRGARAGLRALVGLRAAGRRVQVLLGDGPAALAALIAEAVGAGTDGLVLVGGDGMVHLGVNVVAGTSTPVGIVPAGTGNDIARGLGLPVRGPDTAVTAILAGLRRGPRRVDAVRCTGEQASGWFAGVLGTGFDAAVNERANGWGGWPARAGTVRYLTAVARELPVLRPLEYRLELDGQQRRVRALLVAAANAPSYGGGMRVCPDARMDDGLLDVLVVHPVGRGEFLRILPRVYSGTHTTHPQVEVVRARRVGISSDVIGSDRVVGYADGERFSPLPLQCEVVPGALGVLA